MRLAAASLALLSTLALVPEAAAEPLYRCGAPADPHQPWRGFDQHMLVDAYGQEYGTVEVRDNEQALALKITLDDGWELQDSHAELGEIPFAHGFANTFDGEWYSTGPLVGGVGELYLEADLVSDEGDVARVVLLVDYESTCAHPTATTCGVQAEPLLPAPGAGGLPAGGVGEIAFRQSEFATRVAFEASYPFTVLESWVWYGPEGATPPMLRGGSYDVSAFPVYRDQRFPNRPRDIVIPAIDLKETNEWVVVSRIGRLNFFSAITEEYVVEGTSTVSNVLCEGQTDPNWDTGCSRDKWFWATEPDMWPVTELTILGVTHPAQTLLNFLRGSSTSDMSLLAKQGIVLQLNLAAGASSFRAEAQRLLDHSGALFAQYPFHSNAPDEVASEVAELTADLEAFNVGVTGPGACLSD